MKKVLISMILFYIIVFWIGILIGDFIFPWGGVAESHLHPIYLGMIILSGLIVGCTIYIAELIKKQKIDNKKDY